MSVSIRPERVQAGREAILVCLGDPLSIAEIARGIGCFAPAALANGSVEPHITDQLI
jgi:hypothetical protein